MRFLTMAGILLLPLFDIASLILVGERIGVWATLAAVVAGVVIGGLLVRMQGLVVLAEARRTLQAGEVPAQALFDGVCVLLGGALLTFPGFVSDTIGILLLLPPLRRLVWGSLARRVETSGQFALWEVHGKPGAPAGKPRGPVIEGEFEAVETPPGRRADDSEGAEPPASPWRRPAPGAGADAVVHRRDP